MLSAEVDLIMQAIITVVTGQLATKAYGGVEWLVKTDVETQRWFGAQKVSTEAASAKWAHGSSDETPSERVRSAQVYPVTFIYSTTAENVFFPGSLESIRKVFPAGSVVLQCTSSALLQKVHTAAKMLNIESMDALISAHLIQIHAHSSLQAPWSSRDQMHSNTAL